MNKKKYAVRNIHGIMKNKILQRKRGGISMLKYKNILVPYDGSAHAKKAMAQAADLAAAGEGTKLYIVSVCNMVSAMSNFDQVSIAEGCLTSSFQRIWKRSAAAI